MVITTNWYKNSERLNRLSRRVVFTLTSMIIISGCSIFEQSVQTAINSAVDTAVEREMGSRMAGYSDVMMYQLAYTQTYFVGGYGVNADNFQEGQGSTWRVESSDREEEASYTAERALLQRQDGGSTWWYLRFDPEGEEDASSAEFEVQLSADQQALEMYMQDPETGDIRHHQFSHNEEENIEAEEGEDSLEEYGYQTNAIYAESGGEYQERSEEVTVEAGTFQTDVLIYSAEEYNEENEEYGDRFEYRWWVTEDVPGHLVKFEYRNLQSDEVFRGELIEIRNDYEPRFADL